MRRVLILSVFIFLSLLSFSQSKDYVKFFRQGNDYLENEDYEDALTCFLKAYKIDSTNANINFKIGCCYAELPHHKEMGEKYFKKAIGDVSLKYKESNPRFKKAPYFSYFYYAELLHNEDKLEDSKKMFKIYENYLDPKRKKDDLELLMHFEEMVEIAKVKEAEPYKIYISNLGDSINSPYAEYAPVCDGAEKTLIFTYRGNKSMGAKEGLKTESGKYFEDIFMSTRLPNGKWSKASPVTQINTNSHDASVSLSYDGNVLIIYRDDEGDGNLYYCERNGDNWNTPKKFGPEINSKFWEPSACLSPDMNTLFFVSDRPGGYGGRDIYKSRKLPNGKWSLPINLGPKINTRYDEDSPFMHANGKDFFFSSNGHKTMGGFDIMRCEFLENEDFGDIFYFPYPINTTGDDLFYFVSPDGRRAYYSSSHYDTISKGDNDIYVFSMDEFSRGGSYYVRGGFDLSEGKSNFPELSILITDPTKKTEFGKYAPNNKGEFVAFLPLDSLYQITYFNKNDTLYKENINYSAPDTVFNAGNEIFLSKVKTIKLTSENNKDTDKDGLQDNLDICPEVAGPIENKGCPWPDSDLDGLKDKEDECPDIAGPKENKGCPFIKETEKNIIEEAFSHLEFTTGKDEILSSSFSYLDELAVILKTHKKDWKIRLSGHTDNEGTAEDNMKLSEKRAKSVMKYLIKKGISKERFIVEWFGNTKPAVDNLTAAGRQRNRRVNISVIILIK
ncbi:MAG: OmpA family protein [Bacteroidota bacterium]|jgi:outer membrane protein OmpA-like peptidoglycan-associated protein/tetratricopeptide (TPR) repeat protein